jgi:hypothetical protein
MLVFRLRPQARERVNLVAIPEGCVAADHNIGTKYVSGTEDYVGADVTIRTDAATLADYSA